MSKLNNIDDAVSALRFIKEFKLNSDQVMNKYCDDDVESLCKLIGIDIDETLPIQEKVFTLMTALYPIRFSLLFKSSVDNSAVDKVMLGTQQSQEVEAIRKGRCWSC